VPTLPLPARFFSNKRNGDGETVNLPPSARLAFNSPTTPFSIHGTQGVLEARNVGWKSFGHAFYIQDGTETDNKL